MNNPGTTPSGNGKKELMSRRQPMPGGLPYGPTMKELQLEHENRCLKKEVSELLDRIRTLVAEQSSHTKHAELTQELKDFKDLFMGQFGIHHVGRVSVGWRNTIKVCVDWEENRRALEERLKGTKYVAITYIEVKKRARKG